MAIYFSQQFFEILIAKHIVSAIIYRYVCSDNK